MTEPSAIDGDRIQDYIDDRLDVRDRASVAAYLLAHPELGAEVEKIRRQNEALKAIGQEILDEPVPERLHAALRQPARPGPAAAGPASSRSPFLEAAAAVLLFVVGAAAGWFLHVQLNPPLSEMEILTAQILDAHDFYEREQGYPIDFAVDRAQDLDGWINRSFERSLPPPDLGKFKFAYAGGRLVPTARTAIGHFQFENDSRQRLGVFFWRRSADPPPRLAPIDDERAIVRIWMEGDLNLAVIGDRGNPDFDVITDDISIFYREILSASEG